MKPIRFDDGCLMFAENQPEYNTPPVLVVNNEYVSCWKLTLLERIKTLFIGKVYINILGHQPPIIVSIVKPYVKD